MKDDTVVERWRQPESFSDDPLTEILRAGARQLLEARRLHGSGSSLWPPILKPMPI